MGRKQLALLIAIVTVIGGIPAVGAEHLSAGYEDAPGVQPEETEDEPSVPDADADRGLTEECFEADGENISEIEEAQNADPFCGHLLYQWNNSLQQASPYDQDLKSTGALEIGQFDVRTTRGYMIAHEARLLREDVGACTPFCEEQPGGEALWDAVHEVGSAAELTDSPEDAREKNNNDRFQATGVDIHTPTARYLLEEADTHEMNGWFIPGATRSFVAFLYDDGGQPVDEQRLTQALDKAGDGEFHSDAKPTICGFVPQLDFVGSGGATTCEVPFEYTGPREDANQDFTDGYDDKCKSPAYVCGASAGGAWYANFDWVVPIGPQDGGYQTWHWVVAPTLPDCGVREPGFITSVDNFEDDEQPAKPYLAHEVDVFTNPFAANGAEEAHSVPTVVSTAEEYASNQVPEDVTDLPGLPTDDVAPDTDAVVKADRVEPNADPVGDLEDTSQSLPEDNPSLDRSLGDPCEQLTGSEEEDTVDPWVDIVDGEVTTPDQQNSAQTVGTVGPTVDTEGFGLYGNEDEGQDNDNHPGPSLYTTDGNVGMFTDKDDDGEYDTVVGDALSFTPDKTNADTIEATGAYPMLWDIWVDENLEMDDSSGCTISGTSLVGDAEKIGYGPQTGLFQLVYLNEPTAFVDDSTGEVLPYPAGDNIYLFMSQSARAHYEEGGNEIANQIDAAVEELAEFAGTEAEVQRPGDDFGYASDFQGQCTEDTGGFTLQFSFAHSCQVDCSGDTIVTGYTFQLTQDDISGDGFLPSSNLLGDDFSFGQGTHTWTDVDPFDNDPDRQDDTDDSPPTGDE